MNGLEATIEILKGNKVRRSMWNDDQYWFLKNNKLCNQDNIVFNMTFNELIIGNDWEIYDNCLTSFEALTSLQNGKKIKKINWEENQFLVMSDNKILDQDNNETPMTIENINDKVWIELEV